MTSATSATPKPTKLPSFGFPKSARLLRRAEFRRVYDNGTRLQSSSFAVFYLPRTDGLPPRVGFTTPRALGKAVVRNRLRRRLREAVRLELPAFPRPIDYIFHPRRPVAGASFPGLRAEVRKVFSRCATS